jgi:hypothetical protein
MQRQAHCTPVTTVVALTTLSVTAPQDLMSTKEIDDFYAIILTCYDAVASGSTSKGSEAK